MTTETLSASRPASYGVFVEIGRFARLSIVGFSLLLPLAGAAAVSRSVSASQLAALIAVAIAFHVFAYVSNDVFDLPLDRTEPLRAGSPLVRGLIRPSVALAIALVPVPLTAALHLWAGGPPAAAAALLAAMGLTLIYNRYGKRIAIPVVSDAVQALAWVALALYGAFRTGVTFSDPLLGLAAIVFTYVLLVNALHGGLRDLVNDTRHGARTTAIWLGAKADDEGRLIVPRVLSLYGLALQLALLFLGVSSVMGRWPLAAVVLVAAHVALFLLGRAALRPGATKREVIRAGFQHLFLSMGVVFLPFALFGDAVTATAIVAVYALPVLVLCFRMMRGRSLLPLLLLAAGPLTAEPVHVVTKQELVEAMRVQKQQGYTVTATANGARFNSGVILHLARAAVAANPNGPPLLIRHNDYFEAFVDVAEVQRDKAPEYIRIANEYREDQLVDYRREKVIARIETPGPHPVTLAVNVVTGWDGGKPRYTYEDLASEPPLRVAHERFTSYRLLEFADKVQLIDDIHGVYGRAMGSGLLGLLFDLIGEARAVRSFSALSPEGLLITRTTGRKGFSVTTTATVWPDGKAKKDLPPQRPELVHIETRLKKPFKARYVAIEKKSPRERSK